STVPAHDRGRPDDGDRIQYARPKPIEQYEQQSVQRPQADALRRRAAQDDELLSKDEDLDLEPGARPEQQEQRTSSVLSVSTMGRALHDSLPVLADGLFGRDRQNCRLGFFV